MLAFQVDWSGLNATDPDRLAASLALFQPGSARISRDHDRAYVVLARRGSKAAPWRPYRSAAGNVALFHGWFDNIAAIAGQLGMPGDRADAVYCAAVERWGDDADLRIIGAYCAIVDFPGEDRVRLSRAALDGPPLHYHRSEAGVIAASVPRAIIAAGVDARLDEQCLAHNIAGVYQDSEAGVYLGIAMVRVGAVVHLDRSGARSHKYYDLRALPDVRLPSPEAYVRRAGELLREGVEHALRGYRTPGMLLSGGLDSTIAASHVLDALPEDAPLPAFTFLNDPAWTGGETGWRYPDERPGVEAFARMHPRVRPVFTHNPDRGFDDVLRDLMLAGGGMPAPLAYPWYGVYEDARQAGCDLLLTAGLGNATFSNHGMRGYVEYFRTFRWRQLYRALRGRGGDRRPMWRRFLRMSVVRALPDRLWRPLSRWLRGERHDFLERAGALNPAWSGYAAFARAIEADDPGAVRPFTRSAGEERAMLQRQIDPGYGELEQALEQIFGIARRDVTRYRPFVEFCLGLPTDVFLRDGIHRWLAREMGRGRIPEEIRTEERYGTHHADWHVRIGRRREAYRAEIARMAERPELAALIDTDRILALLDNWPEDPPENPDLAFEYLIAIPTAITAGRYIDWIAGRNAP